MALTTDVTPRIHLEPSQVLKDDNRVKRLIATVSEGIFDDIDEKKASEILQECLKICGGSSETLSQVLQHKFFGGHTPFYWAITNKHPQSHDPPLLKELILYAGELTKETQEDIVAAFRMYFDSVLYEAVKPTLTVVDTLSTCSPSFFQGNEYRPIVTTSSRSKATSTTVCFDIPRFLDRLLVDTELSLQFYALGSTFCLAAAATGEGHPRWMFNLEELPPSAQGAMQIVAELEIQSQGNSTYSAVYYGIPYNSPRLPQMEIQQGDLAEFCRNPYTANERGALRGKLILTKAGHSRGVSSRVVEEHILMQVSPINNEMVRFYTRLGEARGEGVVYEYGFELDHRLRGTESFGVSEVAGAYPVKGWQMVLS